MGLDCTAYEKVVLCVEKKAEEMTPVELLLDGAGSPDDWDYDYHRYTFLSNRDFPDRSDGLVEGLYRIEGETIGWHAGSYSGYNNFRDELALKALHAPAKDVWDAGNGYQGARFYELINFSDCEGFLGPETCAKLAADLDNGEPITFEDDGVWGWQEVWETWQKAIRLAAGSGVIRFH